MKLLIIDKHRALTRSLKDFLAEDFIIDTAGTAREGLRLAGSGNNDLILLNLGPPDNLGGDICREIRAAKINTPMIVLGASDSVKSRVNLLDMGADDYLMKPFSLLELRARLFALTRRMPNIRHEAVIAVGDLRLDVGSRRVQRDGQEITLRRKEFDLLEYLARNSGQVVTRSMIFDHVWESGKERWHNTVDVHIKHLRDKVDRPFGTPLIKTAYGIGYILDDMGKKIT